MKRAFKSDVYQYIQDNEDVTATEIARYFSCDLSHISGILVRLRRDGKIIKVRAEKSNDPALWRCNPQYYIIGKTRVRANLIYSVVRIRYHDLRLRR